MGKECNLLATGTQKFRVGRLELVKVTKRQSDALIMEPAFASGALYHWLVIFIRAKTVAKDGLDSELWNGRHTTRMAPILFTVFVSRPSQKHSCRLCHRCGTDRTRRARRRRARGGAAGALPSMALVVFSEFHTDTGPVGCETAMRTKKEVGGGVIYRHLTDSACLLQNTRNWS